MAEVDHKSRAPDPHVLPFRANVSGENTETNKTKRMAGPQFSSAISDKSQGPHFLSFDFSRAQVEEQCTNTFFLRTQVQICQGHHGMVHFHLAYYYCF